MRISVLGAGYLGAIHATCMAHLGHEVRVYDIDENKMDLLSRGKTPFFEPGFEELLEATLKTERLVFTSSAAEAISDAEVHFICVGTPQKQGSDAADLRYVDSAFETIISAANCSGIIVGKSTVPVGTARRLAASVSSQADIRLEVAWNPEFLREGTAIEDTLKPDRLVFGVESESAEKLLMEVSRGNEV